MHQTNTITVILGKKGTGKTSYAKRQAAPLSKIFIVDSLAEYTDGLIFSSFTDLQDFFDTHGTDHFRCICRFDSDEENEQFFDFVYEVGSCTILAEECDWYAPPDGSASRNFLKLVKYGRHKKVDIIGVSRRPAEISKMLTSQADTIVSFRQEEQRDLEYLEKCGFNPDDLKKLEQFQYSVINR